MHKLEDKQGVPSNTESNDSALNAKDKDQGEQSKKSDLDKQSQKMRHLLSKLKGKKG
uniref:Uncharacterized protein n=1 Tax=Arundo donax TaxID=35708 RepID=A0A0A8YUY9_ARUDO